MSRSDLAAIKLLLDQGIPADAAATFRQLGYECRHVSVIALDADFHAPIAVGGLETPSVVRLRREGCRAEAAVGILGPVLERYRVDLENGALISVKEHRVTCHKLPVGRDR